MSSIDFAGEKIRFMENNFDNSYDSVNKSDDFGNYIEIQHDFGISTGYGHLSKFAQGVVKNRRVRQGQVIGYVGETGIATGPHLDYRVRKDKKYVNPLKMTIPASLPVTMENMDDFLSIVSERQTILNRPIKPRLLVSNQKLAFQ